MLSCFVASITLFFGWFTYHFAQCLLSTLLQVVLVNGGTASTSELLAGALHDSARVPLVGEKTFGKGITQRVVPLSDGSVLLVSTATYMTPNRVPVHKVAPGCFASPTLPAENQYAFQGLLDAVRGTTAAYEGCV